MPHQPPQEIAQERAAAAREQRLNRSTILLTADVWRELAHRIGPEPSSLTVGIVPFSHFIHLTVLSDDEATLIAAALRMEHTPERVGQWRTTFHDVVVTLDILVPRDVE